MRLLLLVAFAAVASTARGASSLRTSAARAQAHLEAEIKPLAAKYDCHIQQDNLKDTLSDILDKNAARVDRLTQKCSDDLGKEKKDAADERTSTKLVFSTAIAKANETRANQTGLAQAEYNRVVGLAEASLDSTEANLVLDVRTSIRDIHTAKATIEASRESRILAARQLSKTRTQVEAGTAVPRKFCCGAQQRRRRPSARRCCDHAGAAMGRAAVNAKRHVWERELKISAGDRNWSRLAPCELVSL